MSKKIFITLVVTFLISFSSTIYAQNFEYINENTRYKALIEDDAELLSESEIDRLASDMIPLTEYGNIAFKSINENSTSTEQFARSFYHNKYGSFSGSLFLIDMDNRMIYIFSDGNNYKVIYDGKAEIIADNVYKYASSEKYYECASNAYKQMKTLLDGGKIMEPMRFLSNILIAVVSGFLICFIYIMFNSKLKGVRLNDIIENCNVSLKVSNVFATKTGEHRVYSPRSSGGGHSSGIVGGGGHSSGGGGGHRF